MSNDQTTMITLGLQRISRLLHGIGMPWKAIHVAGTNGKGSVCAYLSAMLYRADIPTGRFISPHIIDRWDCISINERPISESLFLEVEDQVISRNEREEIGASSFEILTATAFEVFNREQVRVGIVEVGMGGRLDATNVLPDPLVSVISRIGRDHEAFLGDTLAKIAFEKAGIIKPGCPVVIESDNDPTALKEIQRVARELNVESILTPPVKSDGELSALVATSSAVNRFSATQLRGMWLAYNALLLALPPLGKNKELADHLAPAMAHTSLPGRNQLLSLQSISKSRTAPVLLDGAHNVQALEQLSKHLQNTESGITQSRTWLIACSGNKEGIFDQAIPQSDNVIITEFSPVDGMPWVKPTPTQEVMPQRLESSITPVTVREPNLLTALERACSISDNGPIVIVGSLYLASDVLRLLRDVDPQSSWARGMFEPSPLIRDG